MKGKKGLLIGSEMGGFFLTDIGQTIFADIKELIKHEKFVLRKGHSIADRTISSMEEAPYKRLKNTPDYVKFKEGRINEIVETDFLYFYGINWHSKGSYIINRIKNVDAVVRVFSEKDQDLRLVHELLNEKFKDIREKLTKKT